MHKTTTPYITNQNIKLLIDEFLKEYKLRYPTGTLKMLIAGGSALAIKWGNRGTVDIDSDVRASNSIKDSIVSVSKRLNIPDDFINEDFMKSLSYSRRLWDDAICVLNYVYAEVYVVSDLSQLCMKLTTQRRKDVPDIVFLTDKLIQNGCRFSNVIERVQYLYDGRVKINKQNLNSVRKRFKHFNQL